MIYYASDLHFGHFNIIKYENRPYSTVEEMDNAIVEKWNEVVTDEDEVWVLGDVSFHKDIEKTEKLLQQLKGRKHLILGNHDYYRFIPVYKKYFITIDSYKRMKDENREVILFHYPIFNWDMQQFGSYHLYGHVHSQKEYQLNLPNSFNVGIDLHGLKPVTLDELLNE